MDKWVCNKCGASTEEKPESKNTTCSTCHRGRYRMIKTCACGIEFHPDNAKQKYCSLECKYKYMDKGGKKGKHYPRLQRARIGVCAVCGKEFRAVNDYGEKRQKYCSKECWSRRSTVIKACRYCGKEFKTTIGVNKVYCCQKCRNLEYRVRESGDQSHFWKGGKTKESKCLKTSAQYAEWRTAVFERDNYTCQECGAKGYVVAHHIKEQSNYPELRFDVANGRTLCRECHKKTENYAGKVRPKQADS